MLVPTWELGLVLDRGDNKFLVCVGELFFFVS